MLSTNLLHYAVNKSIRHISFETLTKFQSESRELTRIF